AYAVEPELTKKEKRYRDFAERLDRLDHDFLSTRERIYANKKRAFELELERLDRGDHPEYLERVLLLEMARRSAVRHAELLRAHQEASARALYDREAAASAFDYDAEQQRLKARMLANLEDRRKRLRAERESFDINAD
ncbi:hypothetical protein CAUPRSCDRAFT_926, partial [Caulochytrium protostelioides]